jgi:hypothetical protein
MSSVTDDTTSGKATTAKDEGEAQAKSRRPRRRPTVSARQVKAGSDAVRSRVASVIWLIAVACAVILALGALLVALGAETDNPVVQWMRDTAGVLAGPAGGIQDGIFDFEKQNGNNDGVKNALVNWGIAAIAYLVIGRVLDRIIRP